MKVTITLSELQLLRALSMCKISDAQCESVMAQASQVQDVDITAICRDNSDLSDVPTCVAIAALGTIAALGAIAINQNLEKS